MRHMNRENDHRPQMPGSWALVTVTTVISLLIGIFGAVMFNALLDGAMLDTLTGAVCGNGQVIPEALDRKQEANP